MLVLSIIFSLFHLALLPFMGYLATAAFTTFLFLQAYLWGWITMKTDSLWGAVLAHAISDVLFLYAVFSQ